MGFSLSILGIESFTPSLGGYLCGMGQAIWSVVFAPHYDIMVLEYGIDYPGEMDKLLSIAVPDIGIITRIDAVHSQQMGDPTHIAEQKRKMIDASKDIVFLNMDDVYIKQMDDRTDADILWYSIIDGALGDIGYTHATLQTSEVSLLMTEVELFTGDRNWIGSVNILSKALVSYVAIGMSIVSVIAYRRQEKTQELNHLSYHLQPGRLSLFQWIEQTLIIDSSYNASPASIEAMLGVAYRIKHDVYMDNRPLIGIIGEMRELGDLSEHAHRTIAGILGQGLDQIILVGQEVLYTMDELQKIGYPIEQIKHFTSSREAGKRVKQYIIDKKNNRKTWNKDRSKALIFVKGSQNTIYLEEAVKELLADDADISKLGRQDDRRMEKKEKFFASIET